MHCTYDFATIGFRPFPETQEFVTMGVVALDTAARQFDFVLQDARKTGRVLAMFPKAGKALYLEARAKLEAELTSIRNAVNGQGPGGKVPLFPVFREKEDALFIDQDGLTALQAVEQQMAKALKNLLRNAKLLPAYKQNVKIGPDEFQVTFAFAHLKDEHRADRALRPLNFDLATSTDIYNHGDEWIQRMKRLKRLDYRPDQCLIAARAPKDETEHRGEAFRQIVADLLAEDFRCIGEDETGKVLDFARALETPVLKLA